MQNNVLVTGGTGFVGMQIVLQLLKKGYKVKTTVRSLKSKERVIEVLKSHGVSMIENLSFAKADLSKDDGWDAAMEGCDYVLSVASPVFFDIPEDENEVIRPAVEGIIRILKAANRSGVKRVVMTSNFGAVGFSKKKGAQVITTEEDWTDENEPGLSVYEKSKLLAEKAAWSYIETEGKQLEFATVNPVAIFGPSLNNHVSGSFELLTNLLNGSTKRIADIPLNIVDVRDVAELHIRAMVTPEAKGQRFIASADGQISMVEIAQLIRRERPELADKIPTRKLPNILIEAGAMVNQHAREGKLFLDMNRNVSNEKAKKILGWQPLSTQEQATLAAVDSLVKYGLIE
ncbi:SDR family oxidoreductase [Enterococcus sp. BWR-S5]|uniref:SDR family oxidoreductase n=1 Tax=Enterococcus sp. BWR-S5 TaxID=2787714 RepID=UPI001923FED6|nr:aldehyde reductase [Enterococcus sp. BWR-S5]MBL1226620.1 aldehyde reductase [Enterococcus sp. BWR-S5]